MRVALKNEDGLGKVVILEKFQLEVTRIDLNNIHLLLRLQCVPNKSSEVGLDCVPLFYLAVCLGVKGGGGLLLDAKEVA